MNERIKQLRMALGLSQEDFGAKIGLKSKASVSKIEKGINGTTEQTLRSMCREFGASYLWLTTGAGPMFENGEEAAVHVMIDRVMAGENEHVKNLFKSLSDWSAEDWQQVDRLLDKLLAGWTPWADSPGDNKKED